MLFKKFHLLYYFLIVVLISSCAKKPHNIGSSLIAGDEYYFVNDVVIDTATFSSYKFSIPNGTSDRIISGKSDTLEVTALLKFNATLSDTLNSVKIDTAEITLITSDFVDVANAKNDFEFFEITSPWSNSFSNDSLQNLTTANLVGTISDTIKTFRIFSAIIDTTTIRKFINDLIDTTKPQFNGFAIKPKISTNGFVGFYSFNYSDPLFYPKLKIKFSKNNKRDSITISTGVSTFGVKQIIQYQTPLQNLITQAGLNYRTQLKFDLSNIPNKAFINRATLELVLSSKKIGALSLDTLIVSMVRKTAPADSLFYFPVYSYRQSADSLVYWANLTTQAQSWVIDSTKNFGIVIRSLNENSSLDKHLFYLPTANKNLRPKLKITYSIK